MNFTTLQSRVTEYLDRTDIAVKVASWINDTRKDISLKYNFNYLYTETTFTTSANTATYNLPTDYLGHLTVWVQHKKLARLLPREADELTQTDTDATDALLYLPTENALTDASEDITDAPDYYIDRGMQIQLYPTPDDDYTITLKYYAQPTDFTVGADYDYISTFHFEAVIFGAALRGAIFLDDEQKKMNFAAAYSSALGEMVKREKDTKLTDQHIRMKSYKDYDLSTFNRLLKIRT